MMDASAAMSPRPMGRMIREWTRTFASRGIQVHSDGVGGVGLGLIAIHGKCIEVAKVAKPR